MSYTALKPLIVGAPVTLAIMLIFWGLSHWLRPLDILGGISVVLIFTLVSSLAGLITINIMET